MTEAIGRPDSEKPKGCVTCPMRRGVELAIAVTDNNPQDKTAGAERAGRLAFYGCYRDVIMQAQEDCPGETDKGCPRGSDINSALGLLGGVEIGQKATADYIKEQEPERPDPPTGMYL